MIVSLILIASGTGSSCNGKPQPAPATAIQSQSVVPQVPGSWPCFHGADRQNKSAETGLLQQWPDGGPKLLMTLEGLGDGYASVAIAEGMIFTAGTFENQTCVFAFDLDGKLLWRKPNGSAWKVEVSWAKGYDGPRSTPTYDEGVVYHQSETNRLSAYNAKTGDLIWTRDLFADFGCTMPDYGFTESLLVDGTKLFVKPAGSKGFQVCLNKSTGETLWVNNEIPGGYACNSPVLYDFGGFRQLISASSTCYYGVDTETGKLLWKADFANNLKLTNTDAVIVGDQVLMSSGQGGGCELIRLVPAAGKINTETLWKTELMDNYHGGIVYHEGTFYGSGDRSRGWYAIDQKTGSQRWKVPGGMGSLTYADGMLYQLDEKGTLRLVKATPESYQVAGELKVPRGSSSPYWAHPVVCGGKLYVRHGDKVFVYDISSR